MEKVKKPFYKKWWGIAIIVFLVTGVIGSFLDDEEDAKVEPAKVTASSNKSEAKKDEKPKAVEKKEEPKKELTVDEQVKKIITDKLGKNNNAKKKRIAESKVVELADGTKNILLSLNASENLTNNMTRRKMWMDSVSILEPLSKLDGVDNISVEWLFPLTDQYGNTEDGRIMLFNFPKDVRDKVNWKDFDPENIPTIADGYFEHPALSK